MYQADILIAMRGVPWDPVLDVVTMRVPRALEAAAEAAAPAGPGDEAGSDPPTSNTSEAPAANPGESILDGLSGAASSEELVPAAMEVGRVEHFPVRVVSDDQPHGHEDDAIVCDEEESLDPQFEDDSDFEQGPPENSEPEKGDAGMPWEGRSYEEGPPEFEPEVLLELGWMAR